MYTFDDINNTKPKTGRPFGVIKSPNNFRTLVLNKYKINYQCVRGKSWYLIEWPSSAVATRRLSHYQRYRMEEVGIKIGTYDYVIFIGIDTVPPLDEVKLVLSGYVATPHTYTHYQRATIPAWWSNARSALQRANILFKVIDKGITTEYDLLRKHGLDDTKYDPHVLNKDFISGYRLVKLDLTNSTLPLASIRHTVVHDNDIYAIFRSVEYGQPTHTVVQKPLIQYANNKLLDMSVRQHYNIGAEEDYMKSFHNLCAKFNMPLNVLPEKTQRELLSCVYYYCIEHASPLDPQTPLNVVLDNYEAIANTPQSGINDENSERFLTDKE